MHLGVLYSDENDVCGVTLSLISTPSKLKNMPDHGGNRTYDLCGYKNVVTGLSTNMSSSPEFTISVNS